MYNAAVVALMGNSQRWTATAVKSAPRQISDLRILSGTPLE
jgi:hypothetical protein